MATKEGYILRQWHASYYMPEGKRWLSKKWVSGSLLLTARGIKFIEAPKKGQAENRAVLLPFVEFAEIKKSTSTLLYSAIVIETKDGTHWFSSLPNRDGVYAVLEHFWRERLIPKVKSTKKKVSETERTALGTELLRLTQDSEKTLQGAGTMLKHQGEQLDHAMGIMYDMHNDLDIAEKFLSGFESWLGNWRLPKVYNTETIEVIDSKNIPTVYDFPVLYKTEGPTNLNMQDGTVRLSKEGVTIIDKQQMNVHHYNRRDISLVKVLSPWEVTISKYRIGEPDISFTIMSTRMVEILRALEPLYKDKFDLMEPPPLLERGTSTEESSPASSIYTETGEISPPPVIQPISLSAPLVLASAPANNPRYGAGNQIQAQEQQGQREIVSEAEAEELRDMVARMKHMASDIANEQDSQMDKIDALTDTVERATDRIKSDTSRIKKLY